MKRVLLFPCALALLVASCGGSERMELPRRDSGPIPDADHANMDVFEFDVASCLDGSECAEYHEFTREELATYETTCMGEWNADDPCDTDRIVGGCRTDDADGVGYFILWLRSPAYTEDGVRGFCEAGRLPFVPAPR